MRGVGRQGPGSGRGGIGGYAAGPGGQCVCPSCGNKEPHRRSVPCSQMRCSKCGSIMTRDQT